MIGTTTHVNDACARSRVATGIRLLLVSHESTPGAHPGLPDAFGDMQRLGEVESFDVASPAHTARTRGHKAALLDLVQQAERVKPDVLVVTTPGGHGHDSAWVRALVRAIGNPTILYFEGDAWGRWTKPVNASMRAWLAAADVVFTVAEGKQRSLMEGAGARDVRYIPQTYCHVLLQQAEDPSAVSAAQVRYDAVVIGHCTARFRGRMARMPGAIGRAKLVRLLQKDPNLRLAVYGSGWTGRGAQGPIPYANQVRAVRESLMSVNWDHYPDYARYHSNRLPIHLLAGRPLVTTAHAGLDWLPGPERGLFLERTVADVVERARRLAATSPDELLALGREAHRWVSGRLSHRQAARFMLATIDPRFLSGLQEAPWLQLAGEWPR
jgi:hypothetical protein